MQDLLVGIVIGILIMAIIYCVFEERQSKVDKEITVMYAVNMCIVCIVLRFRLLPALLELVLMMLTVFVIDPACEKAIKRRHTGDEAQTKKYIVSKREGDWVYVGCHTIECQKGIEKLSRDTILVDGSIKMIFDEGVTLNLDEKRADET